MIFKNKVGRPSNKVLKTRKILKGLLLSVVFIVVFSLTYQQHEHEQHHQPPLQPQQVHHALGGIGLVRQQRVDQLLEAQLVERGDLALDVLIVIVEHHGAGQFQLGIPRARGVLVGKRRQCGKPGFHVVIADLRHQVDVGDVGADAQSNHIANTPVQLL